MRTPPNRTLRSTSPRSTAFCRSTASESSQPQSSEHHVRHTCFLLQAELQVCGEAAGEHLDTCSPGLNMFPSLSPQLGCVRAIRARWLETGSGKLVEPGTSLWVVNPLRQKRVRASIPVNIRTNHVTVCVDTKNARGRRTGHVNAAEGLTVVLETVELASRIAVHTHRDARRIDVPSGRLRSTRVLEWNEPSAIDEIAFPPIVHISEESHDQFPVGRGPVVHRHRFRYLFPSEAGTGRAVHRAHRVRVVVAAQDGAVRKDPLRDRVDVVRMIDGTELPSVVPQEPVCGHVGGFDLRHIGADDAAIWSDPS